MTNFYLVLFFFSTKHMNGNKEIGVNDARSTKSHRCECISFRDTIINSIDAIISNYIFAKESERKEYNETMSFFFPFLFFLKLTIN